MADRLLLDKIDYENRCITIGDVTYPLEDTDFRRRGGVIDQLTTASFHGCTPFF